MQYSSLFTEIHYKIHFYCDFCFDFHFTIYFQLISVIIMSTEVRTRAIGMLEGGLTQKVVASRIGKDIRTIKRWWKRFTSNQSLDHKPGAGRPSLLNPVAKMIIGNSLGKRHQSTRRLSAKLKSKGILYPRALCTHIYPNPWELRPSNDLNSQNWPESKRETDWNSVKNTVCG